MARTQAAGFQAGFFAHCESLLCAVSFEGAIHWISPAWQGVLGYRRVFESYFDLAHPEDRPATRQQMEILATGPASVVFSNRVRHRDGSFRRILWQASKVPEDDGFHGFYAVGIEYGEPGQSMAERLQSEQLARENQTLLSAIFDEAPIAIALSDAHGRLARVNPACCAMFGYAAHEMVGQPLGLLFPDYSPVPVSGPGRRECALRRGNGALFEAEIVTSRLEGKPYLVSLIADVSGSKQVLRAIHESALGLRRVIENLPVMVDAFDRAGRIVLWNYECERVTGYAAEEVLNHPDPLSLLYPDPDYCAQARAALNNTQAAPPGPRRREWRVRCKDGSDKIIAWSVNTQIQIPGYALWGIGEDVSAREQAMSKLRQAEEYLRRNEASLREVIENLPVMVDAMDAAGNLLLWNRECERVTGYAAEEMLGNPDALALLYPDPEYRRRCQEAVRRVMDAGPGVRRGEWVLCCKDGSSKTIAWSVNTQIKLPGFAVWGVGEDVTARDQALRQLRDNEHRLRSLVEHIPLMIQAFDQEGRLVVWNQQCEQVTGYRAAQMVGQPRALDALYPDPADRLQLELRARLKSRPSRYESEIVCRDGKRKIIAWADLSGEFPIPGWASWMIGEDLTARKQAQGLFGPHLLADALDRLDCAVCASDGRQRLVYVNQAFCRLAGYSREELLDAPLGKVLQQAPGGSFALRHYFSFIAGAHGDSQRDTCRLCTRDRREIAASLAVRRLSGDNGETYLIWQVDAPLILA